LVKYITDHASIMLDCFLYTDQEIADNINT